MPVIPQIEKALRLFRRRGGMLRTGQAIRLGIHPRTLYALRDKGELEQVGRGLFRLSTARPLRNPDLIPIAVRVPRGVVCLISALAYHDLTTQVPHAIDLALPTHAQRNAIILSRNRPPIKETIHNKATAPVRRYE